MNIDDGQGKEVLWFLEVRTRGKRDEIREKVVATDYLGSINIEVLDSRYT